MGMAIPPIVHFPRSRFRKRILEAKGSRGQSLLGSVPGSATVTLAEMAAVGRTHAAMESE